MNILMVTPYYFPYSSGGIESQAKILSQSFSKKNYCALIASSSEDDSISYEGKVKVYRTKKVNPLFKEEADKNEAYEYFKHIIEKEKINVILALNFHAWVNPLTSSALLLASKCLGVNVYLEVHNYCKEENMKMLKNSLWKKYIPISKSVANQIISLGIKKEKIKIIYPPIDTNLFYRNKNDFLRKKLGIPENFIVVVHASRIVGGKKTFEEKGIKELIETFSTTNKNCHLIICAAKTTKEKEAEFKDKLRMINDISKSCSVKERVHVISPDKSEMPEVYNNCNIFLMLSKIETFGNVYAEAMACGLPAIGLSIGGIPEVIKDKKTGYAVKNKEEAIEKLNNLVKDKSLREKMGENGIKHVRENFNIDKIVKEHLKLFSD